MFGSRQNASIVSSGTTNTDNNNPSLAATNQKQESYVIAKYDYASQGPQELSIRKGDRLLLLDDSRHWWKVLDGNNSTGFVPSNYVKREKLSLFDSIRRGIKNNSSTSSSKGFKKSPLTANNDNNPHLISTVSESSNLSPSQPFNGGCNINNNKNNFSDNQLNEKNNVGKPPIQSHSDILVRELGPNFNAFMQTSNNHSNIMNEKVSSDKNSNNLLNLTNSNQCSNSTKILNNNPTAIVKYNYKAQQSDELNLNKGSKVIVLEKSDDGWWKGNLNGTVGWFPSNYVIERTLQDSPQATNDLISINKPDAILNNSQLSQYNDTNSNSYLATTFKQSNSIDPNNKSLNAANNSENHDNSREVLFVVVALYSFQSQNNEELSFSKDERLDIIEKPANDPDWWRACNQLGETGLVPKNYVQIIQQHPRGSPSKSSAQIGLDNNWTNSNESKNNSIDNNQTLNFQSDKMNPSTEASNSGSLAQLARDLENKLKLNDKIWYHGVMSRQQCDQLLNAYAEDGDFLIRNSETNAGDFSVSLKAPIRNKHFRVHYVDDCFCIGQRKFDSLDELVEHYKRTPIYTSATGEKMFLKNVYRR